MLRFASRRCCGYLEQPQLWRRTVSGPQFPLAQASASILLLPRFSAGTRFLSTTEHSTKEEPAPVLGVGKYKTSTGLVCIAAFTREGGNFSHFL